MLDKPSAKRLNDEDINPISGGSPKSHSVKIDIDSTWSLADILD